MKLEAITSHDVTSPSNLIDLDEQLQEAMVPPDPASWAFRGQSQTFGTLVPSFRRKFEGTKSVRTVEFIESELIRAFRNHYSKLEQSMSSMPNSSEIGVVKELRCLSVMQHYGVPTRLLDWTADIWTAAYFACSGDPDHDGELWCYDRNEFRIRSSAIAQQQNPMLGNIYSGDTDPPILGSRGLKLLVEVGQQLTPRMRQQSAHHTVAAEVFADHAPLLYEVLSESANPTEPPDGFLRIVIAQRCKDKVLRYLNDHRNMSASTLFPDFEGLGRFLRWQLDSFVTTLL